MCFHFNKVWLDFTGRSLEQEQGNGWAEGVHTDDFERCLETYCTSFDARLPFKMEYRLRRYDGEYRWLLDTGMPRFADDGTFLGYIGSCIDITERKQAEYLLHRESEKNIALLRNASDGIHILDTEGNIIEISDSFCNMLGYQREEMIGINVTQWDANFSPDECLKVVKQQFLKPVRTLFETRHRCKDGRIIDVEVSGFPLVLDGKAVLFNSSRDITERKCVENELQESQILLQTAQRAAQLGHYVIDLRNRTAITWTNDAIFDEIFGIDEHYIRSFTNLSQIIHSDDLSIVENNLQQTFNHSQQDPTDFIEHRIIRPNDGEQRWIGKWGYVFYDEQNNPIHQVGMIQDITERKQAEAALRISATVFESQEGMMITNTNQVILNVNKAFTLITGYSADEVIGQTPSLLHSGQHDKIFYAAIWQSVQDKGAWQGEMWNRRKSGEIYPEYLTITAVKGNDNIVTHYVATLVDITERKATEEYIHHLAFYDYLTQLPNRRLLQERLKHGIELNRRTGSKMAVLMMDLDKFKTVNDTLGHAAGDELLQQVAKRVKENLREVDMVARLGGDEFMIVIDDVSCYENVAHVAEIIIHVLSQSFTLCKNYPITIGASIGIAIHPQHGSDVDVLMDNADTALYHAKNRGRGCFSCFSEDLTRQAS